MSINIAQWHKVMSKTFKDSGFDVCVSFDDDTFVIKKDGKFVHKLTRQEIVDNDGDRETYASRLLDTLTA